MTNFFSDSRLFSPSTAFHCADIGVVLGNEEEESSLLSLSVTAMATSCGDGRNNDVVMKGVRVNFSSATRLDVGIMEKP